jgi:DNA topoisomerase-3
MDVRCVYLAQFLPPHEVDRTKVMLLARGETLQAHGKRVVVAGWREVLVQTVRDAEEDLARTGQSLPQLSEAMRCVIEAVELKAQKTLPPKPYTHGELVKAMKGVARWVSDPRLEQKLKETTGIGTEATRAGIIGGLLDRGYQGVIGRCIIPIMERMKVHDVKHPDVAALMKKLAYKQAEANRTFGVLRKMFNLAEVWECYA